MDVKTVCLGMLTEGAASGYDLKKQFESTFGHFFSAGYGSIYPALSSLAADGLVDCEEIRQEGKPDRKVYRITDAGRDQLLSALDVAWSAMALGLGVRVLARSNRAGLAAAIGLDVICVFSIWNYLRVVGFDPDGGWVVDRSQLLTLVIPFDAAAAIMAIGALLLAQRRVVPVDSRK